MKKIIYLLFCCLPLFIKAQSTLLTPGTGGNIQVPNLTNAQINAIPSPKKGMVAYDLTFNTLRFYNGTTWIALYQPGCDCCSQYCPNATEVYGFEVPNTISSTIETANIKVDASGNIYITGAISTSMDFGNGILINKYNYLTLSYDMFVAKFNSSGLCQWAKKAGSMTSYSSNAIKARSLDLDASGNVYVGGYFVGNDITNNGTTALPVSGASDAFIFKYDTNGNLLWSKTFGSTDAALGESLQELNVDNLGNIYAVGNFLSTMTVNGNTVVSAGGTDLFLGKFDAATGNNIWLKRGGGMGSDSGNGLSVKVFSGTPKILITGNILGNASIGTVIVSPTSVNYEAFWAEFDPAGANGAMGVKLLGVTNNAQGLKIKIVHAGYAVLAGRFTGSFTALSTTQTATGLNNIFIIGVNLTSGNITKVQKLLCTTEPYIVPNLVVDGSSNIIITSSFLDTVDFLGITKTSPGHIQDVFVLKLDINLDLVCIKFLKGTAEDETNSIAVDNLSNVYLYGRTLSPSLDFGTTVMNSTNYGYEMFIARMFN